MTLRRKKKAFLCSLFLIKINFKQKFILSIKADKYFS